MDNIKKHVLIILVVMLAAFNIYHIITSVRNSANQEWQYTLYIGTNDKDTYQPEIPYDEALKMVAQICSEHLEGYTVFDADGYWTDEKGMPSSERTIVCKIYQTDSETIKKIIGDVLVRLNQNSVLVEKSEVKTFFVTREGGM